MSSKYERELRDILMGEKETIEDITKTMDDWSTEVYVQCVDKPFLIMRGAGSLGIDLFATRWDIFFAIEEKSCGQDKLYFSSEKRLREQHEIFEEYAKNVGLPYVYCYRQKGKRGEKWSVFRTEESKIGRILGDVSDLPLIPETVHDSKALSYEDGLPLSKFLHKLRGEMDE